MRISQQHGGSAVTATKAAWCSTTTSGYCSHVVTIHRLYRRDISVVTFTVALTFNNVDNLMFMILQYKNEAAPFRNHVRLGLWPSRTLSWDEEPSYCNKPPQSTADQFIALFWSYWTGIGAIKQVRANHKLPIWQTSVARSPTYLSLNKQIQTMVLAVVGNGIYRSGCCRWNVEKSVLPWYKTQTTNMWSIKMK